MKQINEGFLGFADLAYGVLAGMGDAKMKECNDGLYNTVDSFFLMYEHSAVYLPWNLMKFGIYTTELNEAGNMVYMYIIPTYPF